MFGSTLGSKLASALAKTANLLQHGLGFTGKNPTNPSPTLVLDEAFWETLETTLIRADVGVKTTLVLLENLQEALGKTASPQQLQTTLQTSFLEALTPSLKYNGGPVTGSPLHVVLVVGVNGAGKTTLVGRLAAFYKRQGHRVIIGAADTFRAAADSQLLVWAQRAEVELISLKPGSDPAAVVFQTLEAAKSEPLPEKPTVVLLDTAGRLQNKFNLMEELSKLYRVLNGWLKNNPAEPGAAEATVETLLVVDGTTGQNALEQARVFGEAAKVTAVAITKLDGSAKGGVVLALNAELGLPVAWVGLGEGLEDLAPFEAAAYVEGLLAPLSLA